MVLQVALLVGAVRAVGADEGLLAAVDHEMSLHVVLGVAAVECLVAEAAVDLERLLLLLLLLLLGCWLLWWKCMVVLVGVVGRLSL